MDLSSFPLLRIDQIPLIPTETVRKASDEIAGFVIGAGLLGLVFAASRLDGVIADAQVRGFERDKDERWKKTKSVEGGGNIFILPDDEDE